MSKKKFVRFEGRLRNESVLKSVYGGIAAGGVIASIVAIVSWFLEFDGFIVSLASFFVSAAVAGAVLYFLAFRPSVKGNAKRLDRYGLEERLITMVGLENDESYIAKRQREDAMESLKKLDAKRVKYRLSLALVVMAFAATLIFTEMATLEILSEVELVPSGTEAWLKVFPPPPPPEYEVEYLASEGGVIMGEAEQSVTQGQDSSKVLAFANPGYMFLCWSDGGTDPSRVDAAVEKNISVKAVFIEVKHDVDEEEDFDEPNDAPGDDGEGEESLENNSEGGDRFKEVNWVIDGETYYRDEEIFNEYYGKVLEMLKEGKDIPEEYRRIIELYFNVIK